MQNFDNQNKTRKKLFSPLTTNEVGKLQPQSIELEEAVLGAMLLEKDALIPMYLFFKTLKSFALRLTLLVKPCFKLALPMFTFNGSVLSIIG
jgi:hypothetical protein